MIDPTRAHDVVERILGEEFTGVVQCDYFLAYDPLPYEQPKCLRHLLRRRDELTESKSGAAVKFSRQVAQLLRGAIRLKPRLSEGRISPAGFRVARGRLAVALDRWLAGRSTDADNAKLAKLLRQHREQWLVFLAEDAVAPTNAEGEQEIRPAVAVRKMSACNRRWQGADVHAVWTSVIRTCRKHGQDFLALILERLRHPTAALPAWLNGLALAGCPTPEELATGPP